MEDGVLTHPDRKRGFKHEKVLSTLIKLLIQPLPLLAWRKAKRGRGLKRSLGAEKSPGMAAKVDEVCRQVKPLYQGGGHTGGRTLPCPVFLFVAMTE